MYLNGARGLQESSDLQDQPCKNVEKMLATIANNQHALSCFSSIWVRYSRDSPGFQRDAQTGAGGPITALWTGIRDFELKGLGERELSAESGVSVEAPPNSMLSAGGLFAFAKNVISSANQGDQVTLWLWGHGQGPGIAIAFNEQQQSQQSQVARMLELANTEMFARAKPYIYLRQTYSNYFNTSEGESYWLTPGEIEFALRTALPEKKKFALITFEACSVCTLELASSVSSTAEFLVASQGEISSEVSSKGGWNYSSWPNVFCGHSEDGIEAIAKALVGDYIKHKVSESCVSALNLTYVPELLIAIGKVASKALADVELAMKLLIARRSCLAMHPTFPVDLVKLLGATQCVDIALLLSEAIRICALEADEKFTEFSSECNNTLHKLNSVVSTFRSTPDLKPLVNGLSIWFPSDNKAITSYSSYVYFANTTSGVPELAEFKVKTHWDKLMKMLLPRL
jgi:Clostripain family